LDNKNSISEKSIESLEALSKGSIQTCSASLIILELLRLGVTKFILSPGARAIPFVLVLNALKEDSALAMKPEVILINDERAASFFAQGVAKSGSTPCLICTSGTAVANYLPGVVEAFYSKTPLLIITTDRPWELQDAGANQTINQKEIFSHFVSRKIEISAPEKYIHPHSLLSNIDSLIRISEKSSSPVHLNIAFRKPFYDGGFSIKNDLPKKEVEIIQSWYSSEKPYVELIEETKKYPSDFPTFVSKAQNKILFILGPSRDQELVSALIKLSELNNIPILADIHSNSRTSTNSTVFSFYNFFLDSILSAPDQVFFFGDRFISDPLARFLGTSNAQVTLVSNHFERQDAVENEFLSIRKQITIKQFFSEIVKELSQSPISFFEEIRALNQDVETKIISTLQDEDSSERSIFFNLPKLLQGEVDVFLSASLIFREADCYSQKFSSGVRLYSNRGATGIDGIIASSLGVASVSKKPLVCILGDQAALHDLNSLSLVSNLNQPVIILVINNSGGAIFNLMKRKDLQDTLINPHSRNFKNFAEGFDLEYLATESVQYLAQEISAILKSKRKVLLEFKTDGAESSRKLYQV